MTTTKRIVAALLMCMAFSGISHGALVGYWNFDNDDLVESSGMHVSGTHDGESTGLVAYSDGPTGFGRALDLSAGTSAVKVLNSNGQVQGSLGGGDNATYAPTFDANLTNRMSIAVWVQGLPGKWLPYVSNQGESAGYQLRKRGDGPNLCLTLRGENVTNQDPNGGSTTWNTEGEWHHLAAVWDKESGNRLLYIDGVLDGSSITDGSDTNSVTAAIDEFLVFSGRDNSDGLNQFSGVQLDEIRIYDTALTQSDVLDLIGEDLFYVSTDEIEMTVLTPATTATGSVDVSFYASTSITVNVSITDQSHAGAFSNLTASTLMLTETVPTTTPLEFLFDNAVANLIDGESATGLVTLAWSVDGQTEINEVIVPISADYIVLAPGGTRILWDIGKPSLATDIPSTTADFTAAGITEEIYGWPVSNIAGAKNMTDGAITVSLSNYVNANIKDLPYTGAGASIIKEYAYIKNTDSVITIGGLSSQLAANTEYSFYLWGKGDAADQNSIFTFDGTSITTSLADPYTTDAEEFMAKFSFTTDAVVADELVIDWARIGTYSALNGLAIVPASAPDPTIGDLSIVALEGGAKVAVSFATSVNGTYFVKWGARLANETSWTDSSEPIPGTGGAVTVTNDVSADQEFYRAYIQD